MRPHEPRHHGSLIRMHGVSGSGAGGLLPLSRPLFTAWAVAGWCGPRVMTPGLAAIKSARILKCPHNAGPWHFLKTSMSFQVYFDQAAPRPVFPGCQSNKGRITPSIAVLRNTEWCRGPGVARHGAQRKNLEEFPVHACPVCLDRAPSCLKRPRHAGQDQLSMPTYMARLTSRIM